MLLRAMAQQLSVWMLLLLMQMADAESEAQGCI
jgi:hypothetical protein